MEHDDVLKIWAKIDAMPEKKAKFALLGLTLKDLGMKDPEEIKRIVDSLEMGG